MTVLASYDALFSNDENEIIQINLDDLVEFKEHPFSIPRDENFNNLKDSIQENGVITPITVRKRDDGKYEIISGHRRVTASRELNLESIPAMVRKLTDEEAVIQMVDANLQREDLLPMDKAKAYKMKMDALKKLEITGRRDQELAKNEIDSARNIQRYLKLNNLIENFQEMLNAKELPFNTAVELSYLDKSRQEKLLNVMLSNDKKPSIAQAKEIKTIENDHDFAIIVENIFNKAPQEKLNIKVSKEIKKKFFEGLDDKEIENLVISLLEDNQ